MRFPNLSFRCDRSWDELEGDGPIRSCDRCRQPVYDLHALEPRAREALLLGSQPACVRFVPALLALLIAGPADAGDLRPGEGDPPSLEEREVIGALDRSLIERPIQRNLAELRRAYEARLEEVPGLRGKIVVTITLRGGEILAEIKRSDLGDAIFEAQVIEYFQGLDLQITTGAEIVVIYPLLFGPSEPERPDPERLTPPGR